MFLFFNPPFPQILSRYDLCLIQEVRDSKGEAVKTLVEDLNRSELFCVEKPPHPRFSSQIINFVSADLRKLTRTHMWKVNGWDGIATRSNMSTFTGIYRCELQVQGDTNVALLVFITGATLWRP